MPELPDIELYLHALRPRILQQPLERIRIANPFLVRSVAPPLDEVHGRAVTDLRRLGKRLVWAMDGDFFLVIHLMIAGRLRMGPAGAKIPGKAGLAAFDFPAGSIILTEAGSQRRASLYLVRGEADLAAHDPGGLEVLGSTREQFAAALTRDRAALAPAADGPVDGGTGREPSRARDWRAHEMARRSDCRNRSAVPREGHRVS